MTAHDLDLLLRSLGMHPDSLDFDLCMAQFRTCMQSGLRGKPRGMLMLPTMLSPDGQIPRGESVIVMDAGGTNFRRAVAHFDTDGTLRFTDLLKAPLPGTQGEIGKDEFFDCIAELLLPIINRSNRIGFCFSFPTDVLPNLDGRLRRFCKEVRIRDSEGIEVCAELKQALRRKGIAEEKHCVLLNDSVAALLGGKAASAGRSFDSYIGYIHGTGLNCCYTERTHRIAAAGVYAQPRMIINMESGMHEGFPPGSADLVLDRESERPGDHLFEKMVAGGYLGRLMVLTAQFCAKRGAFSPEATAALMQLQHIELADVGSYLEGGTPACFVAFSDADAAALRQIITRVYERAAKLLLISTAAVLIETDTGRDPNHPVCLAMEGTTFRKSRILREAFFRGCETLLHDSLGFHVSVVECEDATLSGAAIAALLN